MTFQLEAYGVLTKSAQILKTLGGEGILPEDADLAAAKLDRAARALAQEPLTVEDINQVKATVKEAAPSLRRLLGATEGLPSRQWLCSAIEGFNGTLDLLDGIAASHEAVPEKPAEAAGLSQAVRKLIPASWWGSK